MKAPKFSVVIPTRERANTLRFALQTCLNQGGGDYEIVVCDNCSSPATRETVDGFNSPLIKYVRSDVPLAMSHNWELAVSHASGEWITVIGDDDGLLPHALREFERLTAMLSVDVIRWGPAFYTWPSVALEGQGNYLRLPMGKQIKQVNGVEAIASVIAFRSCYSTLPMLYNSLVRRTVLDRLKAETGRIFANPYPDVYSGFALAHLSGTYASLGFPMTVAGSSGGSYGIATLFLRGKSRLDREFREQNAIGDLPRHPFVPDLSLFPSVPVVDSYAVARALLFPDEPRLTLDRQLAVSMYVGEFRADTEEDWHVGLELIRATLVDEPTLEEWFDNTLNSTPWKKPVGPPVQLKSLRLGFDGVALHLDVQAFGVGDVFAASRLCDSLLNPDPSGVAYVMTEAEGDIVLLRQIREKEAAYQAVKTEAEKRLEVIENQQISLTEQSLQLDRYRRVLKYPRGVYRAFRRLLSPLAG